MKLNIKIFLTGLLLTKILLGSIFIFSIEFDNLFFKNEAAALETGKIAEEAAVGSNPASEEETINLDYLIRKKSELSQQEKAIDKKREELLSIQNEISRQLEEIRKVRNEIDAQIAEKKAIEDGKIKHLIKIYSAMKPQKAASLIEKLDLEFSINLLSMMKGEEVGNILSFVDVEKAAKISEGLAKNK